MSGVKKRKKMVDEFVSLAASMDRFHAMGPIAGFALVMGHRAWIETNEVSFNMMYGRRVEW